MASTAIGLQRTWSEPGDPAPWLAQTALPASAQNITIDLEGGNTQPGIVSAAAATGCRAFVQCAEMGELWQSQLIHSLANSLYTRYIQAGSDIGSSRGLEAGDLPLRVSNGAVENIESSCAVVSSFLGTNASLLRRSLDNSTDAAPVAILGRGNLPNGPVDACRQIRFTERSLGPWTDSASPLRPIVAAPSCF